MKIHSLIIIFLFSLTVFFSCKKDKLYEGKAFLEFSTDTVKFDTVFTTIGTTTLFFTAKNPYKQDLNVSSIYLAQGKNSFFRMNVDGEAGLIFNDVVIPGEDSIFIFVEANIDPTNQGNPMVIQDSIVFEANGSSQDVDLVAWGQDVHLIDGQIIETQIWENDKPYLIYNSMLVDTLHTLTIKQGCKLHFHHNSSLYVKGTLKVEGDVNEPVYFSGDRLEDFYDDNPGQWGYIHLLPGSFDNNINYAVIRNAIIGIQVDTVVNNNPALIISNTIIENMNAVGLYAQGSRVLASNCVFANCGQYTVALNIGGSYNFYHCTMANYWGYAKRSTPSVILNNYYKDVYGIIQVRQLNATFANSIIYGNEESELGLSMYDGTEDYFTYKFDHCLLKISNDFDVSNTENFVEIVKNENPKFVSTTSPYNYQLDTLSAAKDKGSIDFVGFIPEYSIDLTLDLNGESRLSDNLPDLGAYERFE